MQLYHSPGSRSTRVLWTLEELGEPYELTFLTVEERRGEAHRKLHPLGRVPVLELDDGRTLYESAGICIYLADQHPEIRLTPAFTAPERPFLYQWCFFSMTELEPALISWAIAQREEADETRPIQRFRQVAAVLEATLRQRTWLLGKDFSVADVITARILNVPFERGLTTEHPAVHEYIERAFARPAYKRAQEAGALRE